MVNKKSLATFVRTVGNQVISGFKHFLNNVKIGGDLIHDPDPLGSTATNLLTVDAQGVVRKATSLAGATGTVTSVALTAPSAFTVTGSPITTSGTIAISGAGTAAQYVRGDGQLGDFPSTSGGGSSVSYYLNGSVNQGTFGGNVYREFSKTPIIGAGTDFTISSNGYIAQFITDANDPSLLEIPGGNWNFEFYFSSSSSGGTPSFYVELSKYDGTTFTPIANNSAFPEFIAFGTTVSAYFGAIAVPQTTLAVTDRLAIRVYVIPAGRTITLHTENGHLCQVITTFSTGLNALNGLTKQVQYFATGTTGTDFSINSVTDTHTFNLPTASSVNRGALSSADWITFNNKQNALTNPITGTGTTNYLPKFTGTTTLGDSQIFDNGTNVGIGTASPVSALSIYKASGNAYIEISGNGNTLGSTSMLYGQDVGSSGYVWNRANAPVYFGTNNSTKMFLNTNGYLGIGTTTPGALLQVGVSNVTTDALLRLGVAYDTIRSSRGGITWHDESNTTGKIYTEYDGTMVSMVFGSLYNSGYNSNNLMIIRGNGNVGIGTTTPSEKLRVNGTFSSNSLWTDSGAVSYWGGYPTAFGGLTWDTGYATVFATAGNSLQFGSNGASPDMVIDTSGNVGIGTTSPDARLQITQTGGTQLKIVSGDAFGSQDVVIDLVSAYDYRGRGILYRNSTDNNKWFSGVPYTGGGYSIGYSDTTPEYHANSKLFVSSGGNVGIGTTSPSHKLQVVTNAVAGKQNMAAIDRTAGNLIRFTNPQYSTDASMGLLLRVFPDSDARQGAGIIASGGANNATTDLDLFVTTSPDGLGGTSYSAVKINGLNGNVGIGNTSPATKLDVNGSINIANGNNLTWGGAYGAGIPTIVGYNAGTGGALYFYPNGSTSGEKMRLHASGNLSIGNTNDTFKLDVSGTGRFTNEIYVGGVWSTSYGPRVSGDPIKFLNWSGGELARIDTTSGNVGIGTTSPAQKFHVQGSNLMATFRNSSTSANQYTQLEFIAGSRDAYIWLGNQNTTDWAGDGGLNIYTGTGNMDFWTAATQKMRITSTGNVGIGTTSPAASLHVGATGGVIFGPTAGAVGTAQITTQNPVSPVSTRFAFGTDGTGWQYRIAKNTAGTIVDLVTVADSGNVGIGTTSPSAKLNVSGDIHLGDYGSASVRVLDFRTSNSVFEIATNGTSGALGTTMTYSWANGGQGPLKFNNAAGEVMRLSPTGNVGIGTTSPASILHLFKTSYPVLTIGSGTVTGNVGIDTGNNFMSVGTETNHPLSFATNNSAKMRITPGGSLLLGDNITPGETAWFGTAVFGKNGTDKVITGYLTSLTNGAVIGGHNSALNAWANLNIVGTNVIFRDGSESEHMRIASGGNVGIGTTSPGYKLEVSGDIYTSGDILAGATNAASWHRISIATGGFIAQNGSKGIGAYQDASVAEFFSYDYTSTSYQPLIFRTSTLNIANNGGSSVIYHNGTNVGIGTTSPIGKLQIAGTSGNLLTVGTLTNDWGGDVAIGVTNGNGVIISKINTANETNRVLVFYRDDTNGATIWGYTPSGGGANVGFQIRANASSYFNGGNVGIGTTSPAHKLSVVGSGAGSAHIGDAGFGSGNYTGISLNDTLSTANYNFLSSPTDPDLYINRPSTRAIRFREGNSDQVSIVSGGNVGIGTTSPYEKLEVAGAISATGAVVGLPAQGHSTTLAVSGGTSYLYAVDWGAEFKPLSVQGKTISLETGTGGTSARVTIDNSGNVGIGTTSPATMLHISGTGNTFTRYTNTTNSGQLMDVGSNSSGQHFIFGYGAYPMLFGTDGSERLRITSAGNVGINSTASSVFVLDVFSRDNAYNTRIYQPSTSTGAYVTLLVSGAMTSAVGYFGAGGSATGNPSFRDNVVIGSQSAHPLVLNTSDTERMRITSAGNVGIGTTTPAQKLSVEGGGIQLNANNAAANYYLILNKNNSQDGGIIFSRNNANDWQLVNIGGTGNLSFYSYGTSSEVVTFAKSTGNVGIGTTSPSVKLHVEGRIYAGDIGISTTSPTQKLHVVGNARITGWIFDSLNSQGNPGDVLTSTSTGMEWLPGGGGGGGTTITVKEEGTTVSSSISTLNFVGSNVNATASGSTATISVRDNVGTGSQYLNDLSIPYAIPGSYTDTVNINGTDIIVAAPNSPKGTETVIAILTFGISNITGADRFNAFYFRLYNGSTSTPITDTEHRWSSYMSVDEPTTVATFHIPIKINDFAQGDDIYVQCQTSVLDAPEIYYCALSLIKGTE
jgi:hypothetical protein